MKYIELKMGTILKNGDVYKSHHKGSVWMPVPDSAIGAPLARWASLSFIVARPTELSEQEKLLEAF